MPQFNLLPLMQDAYYRKNEHQTPDNAIRGEISYNPAISTVHLLNFLQVLKLRSDATCAKSRPSTKQVIDR